MCWQPVNAIQKAQAHLLCDRCWKISFCTRKKHFLLKESWYCKWQCDAVKQVFPKEQQCLLLGSSLPRLCSLSQPCLIYWIKAGWSLDDRMHHSYKFMILFRSWSPWNVRERACLKLACLYVSGQVGRLDCASEWTCKVCGVKPTEEMHNLNV